MRLTHLFPIPALMLALVGPPALAQSGETANPAGSPAEIRAETRELLKDLQAYSAEQRDQAVAAAKTALDKADQRIDDMQDWLDENWPEMTQTAREQARASMDALRARRTQVAESYGSLKTSSAGAWEAMKAGFSESYQALGDAWDESVQAFSSDDAEQAN